MHYNCNHDSDLKSWQGSFLFFLIQRSYDDVLWLMFRVLCLAISGWVCLPKEQLFLFFALGKMCTSYHGLGVLTTKKKEEPRFPLSSVYKVIYPFLQQLPVLHSVNKELETRDWRSRPLMKMVDFSLHSILLDFISLTTQSYPVLCQ